MRGKLIKKIKSNTKYILENKERFLAKKVEAKMDISGLPQEVEDLNLSLIHI